MLFVELRRGGQFKEFEPSDNEECGCQFCIKKMFPGADKEPLCSVLNLTLHRGSLSAPGNMGLVLGSIWDPLGNQQRGRG